MVDLDRGIGSPLGGSATATAANGIGTGMKATTIGQVCHKREGGGGVGRCSKGGSGST